MADFKNIKKKKFDIKKFHEDQMRYPTTTGWGAIDPSLPPHWIDTAGGRAYYVKTETEDRFGNWNDNYFTRDGYWVIHKGKKHHVYKVE